MYCPRCGKKNVKGATYCSLCGMTLPKIEKASSHREDTDTRKTPTANDQTSDKSQKELEIDQHVQPVTQLNSRATWLAISAACLALFPLLPQFNIAGANLSAIDLIKAIDKIVEIAPSGTSGIEALSIFAAVYILMWILAAVVSFLSCYEVFSKKRANSLKSTFLIDGILFLIPVIASLFISDSLNGWSIISPTFETFLGIIMSVIGFLGSSRDGLYTKTIPLMTQNSMLNTPLSGSNSSNLSTASFTTSKTAPHSIASDTSQETIPSQTNVLSDSFAIPVSAQRIYDASSTALVDELKRRGVLGEEEVITLKKRMMGQ